MDRTGSDDFPLSDRAYDKVEAMIVSLELSPGTIFSESELAERIGIGRTPLREALQRLASERLVTALPRRGMLVAEINASEYLNLLQTRASLDKLIAKQAARRATPEEREALVACSVGMGEAVQANDDAGFMSLDRTFDNILERACRNPYAFEAVSPLHAHCRRFWSAHRHHGDLAQSATLHARIMQEVASGNAREAGKASKALIAYMEWFARTALDL